MRRTGRYIAIDGPIGVGKTSLAKALAGRLDARSILDESGNNPFLDRFYENPDKYALPAQLYFLLTRYNQQRQLLQQELFAQSMVADYILARDRIFARLNLDPDELVLYENVYRLLGGRIAKPDLVVYIRARTQVLGERLHKRGRPIDRRTSYDYLERVAGAFRDFFFYYEETPLLVVDTSEIDFVADPADLDQLVREIDRVGTGVQYYVPRKS